jgi:hypothetical protein
MSEGSVIPPWSTTVPDPALNPEPVGHPVVELRARVPPLVIVIDEPAVVDDIPVTVRVVPELKVS